MYKFELNTKEIVTYERWKASLLKKASDGRIEPVSFTFTETGIGVVVTATHGLLSKDITDYSSW